MWGRIPMIALVRRSSQPRLQGGVNGGDESGDRLSVKRVTTLVAGAASVVLALSSAALWAQASGAASSVAMGASGALAGVAAVVGLTGGRVRVPIDADTTSAQAQAADSATGLDAIPAPPGLTVARDLGELLEEVDGAFASQRRLLRGIGHDLRSPLASVAFTSEQLADGQMGELSEDQAEACRLVAKTARRLIEQVQVLYAYAEARGETSSIRVTDVGVAKTVRRMTQMFEPLAAARGLGMSLHVKGRGGVVRADPRILERLVANVLDNAIKFTDEGNIRVSTWDEGGQCVIEVRDTGIGISASDLSRVAQNYYRGDSGADRPGTGIGLAVTKEFAEGLGGMLGIESAEGRGTIVTIRIPISAADADDGGVEVQ